jgi:hypothetical protein
MCSGLADHFEQLLWLVLVLKTTSQNDHDNYSQNGQPGQSKSPPKVQAHRRQQLLMCNV